MDKRLSLKLNGGRIVVGVLRGFDPFMNLVIDEAVEQCKTGQQNAIGMVVRLCFGNVQLENMYANRLCDLRMRFLLNMEKMKAHGDQIMVVNVWYEDKLSKFK